MNRRNIFLLKIAGLFTVTSLGYIPVAQAQFSSSFLDQTECRSATPGSKANEILLLTSDTIAIGREVLPRVAVIKDGNPYASGIYGRSPVEVVCNLKPNFQSLKFVFGLNGENKNAKPENKLLFKIFLDGKLSGSKTVSIGPKQQWILNVKNVKSVSLRVECISRECPGLSFVDASLK